MGQLISSHGGKFSKSGLDDTAHVNGISIKVEFENSMHHLPVLNCEESDLTQWQPQQLSPTYLTNGFLRNGSSHGPKRILFSARDIGNHQTPTRHNNINTDKATNGDQAGSTSNKKDVLDHEREFTQTLYELADIQVDAKYEAVDSTALDLRGKTSIQRNREAPMTEIPHMPRSASLGDMAQVASYVKTPEADLKPDSSDESWSDESVYHLYSSRRRGIASRSQLSTQASDEKLLRRRSSISTIVSLSTQKTEEYPILPLSRQTSPSRTLRLPIYSSQKIHSLSASSLWSPTSEETDIYRINLLSNLHFCTYGCKEKSFKRKLDWIRHEAQIHEPLVTHTCLLHVSDTLSSDPCPGRLCVSTMDSGHLAHFHNSFSCFHKPSISIERYQTDKADLLLEHLRERHGLSLEMFPDYWSSDSRRKTKWWCGFCRGMLKSWKERSDHISLHFTREGCKMEAWKNLDHIPFPAVLEAPEPRNGLLVKELSLGGQFSFAQLRRSNAVRENQEDEWDNEI